MSAETCATHHNACDCREQKFSDLREKASALVAKLQECEPHINAILGLEFARTNRQYTGPNYGAELEALKKELESCR